METSQPQFIQLSDQAKMSPTTSKLFKAMALAQGEMGSAPENAKNPHFGSSYADIESVINTAKPILAKHGLAIWQMPTGVPPFASVGTLVSHESGEWVFFALTLRPAKDDPQGHGGAITYARRYSEESVLNMGTKDDDGNQATGLGNQPTQSSKPTATSTPPRPPVKPVSNPNDAYPIDHVMTFKKFRGMNVNQTPKHEIDGYLKWLMDASKKPGGIPVPQEALMLMEKIDDIVSQNYKTGDARQSDGPPPGMFEDIPF